MVEQLFYELQSVFFKLPESKVSIITQWILCFNESVGVEGQIRSTTTTVGIELKRGSAISSGVCRMASCEMIWGITASRSWGLSRHAGVIVCALRKKKEKGSVCHSRTQLCVCQVETVWGDDGY